MYLDAKIALSDIDRSLLIHFRLNILENIYLTLLSSKFTRGLFSPDVDRQKAVAHSFSNDLFTNDKKIPSGLAEAISLHKHLKNNKPLVFFGNNLLFKCINEYVSVLYVVSMLEINEGDFSLGTIARRLRPELFEGKPLDSKGLEEFFTEFGLSSKLSFADLAPYI